MLYNTMSREKEPFKPADGNKVKLYTCGPTIYDFAHIGNFRAFLMYDMIKRWLTYCGYDVDHVCNLTDVDDKIIQRMQRDGVTLKDLTSKYADFFMEDLKKLNILPARAYPRATDHIDDMVEMISGLVEKGNAYEQQGSYYFKVDSFPDYGKLAKIDFDNMQDGAGEGGGITDTEAFEKANNRDFALWKSYKPEDGEVFWETKIGKGAAPALAFSFSAPTPWSYRPQRLVARREPAVIWSVGLQGGRDGTSSAVPCAGGISAIASTFTAAESTCVSRTTRTKSRRCASTLTREKTELANAGLF